MQKYVTPLPGRTPNNSTITTITDREDYKLIAKLTEYQPLKWQLTVSQWIPETGWNHKQYFMEPEELVRFKELFG